MASGEWTGSGQSRRGAVTWGAVAGLTLLTATAVAGPVPDYDFDWATIGDVGNPMIEHPGYPLEPTGRGSVGYRYRISKYEVTTAQWMEFVNTFSTQSNALWDFASPAFWGATTDDDYTGPGRRYVLRSTPDAARLPVFGITWREAAQYCNWLHNGKGSNLDAIANGVYDTSTFGENPDGSFSDQLTHHADAQFWIPSWDEWLKAAHYNPTTKSWNEWPTTDGGPLIPGLPGAGNTSAGYYDADDHGYFLGAFDIPLGSYDTVSAYGLYDVSGGASEWTEQAFNDNWDRVVEGMFAGETVYYPDWNGDSVYSMEQPEAPWNSFFHGLRLASPVPSPATGTQLLGLVTILGPRRRR